MSGFLLLFLLFQAYFILGDACKTMCDIGTPAGAFSVNSFCSRAIESYLNGYKFSSPKVPLIICKALLIAVHHGNNCIYY